MQPEKAPLNPKLPVGGSGMSCACEHHYVPIDTPINYEYGGDKFFYCVYCAKCLDLQYLDMDEMRRQARENFSTRG